MSTLSLAGACKPDIADVSTSECASGRKWVGGDEESPLMHPGRDCVDCHSRSEGPNYVLAGTVYPDSGLNDPNDCLGVEGASVLVEGAGGEMFSLETNEAGNFYLAANANITFPLHVRVENMDGTVRQMATEVPQGGCASCHTSEGANAAAGRIISP